MKRIAIISPLEAKPIEYSFPNRKCVSIQYNRSKIADAISDDYGWHDFFSSQQLAQTDFAGIIIDRSCKITDAVRIILHLKLTAKWEVFALPIVWVNDEDYGKIARSFQREVILPSEAVHFFNEMDFDNYDELFSEITEVLESASAEPDSGNDFMEHIFLTPLTGSHDLTNEWGAYQLAQVAGLKPLLDKIASSKNRQTDIYFKYLKAKNRFVETETALQDVTPPSTTQANANLFCLLVDDKHANGWSLVLNGILQNLFANVKLELLNDKDLEESDDHIWQTVQEKINSHQPSIIFLDLRLRKEEASENFMHTEIMNFSGGRLLGKIKEAYPYISVIMFTASNKAWNMEQLLDHGADGYFIKPSLEVASALGVLKRDYKAFESLIVKCHQKQNVLASFWRHTENILSKKTLIEERSTSAGSTKVEERIRERLKMFFGLLKRSWEDKSYNRMFFYSDVELAFMTLWSCLNDLQYIYYDKTEPGVTTRNGKSTPSIKIEDYLINALQLGSDFRDPKFYLQRVKSGTRRFETTLNVEYSRSVYFGHLVPPVSVVLCHFLRQ